MHLLDLDGKWHYRHLNGEMSGTGNVPGDVFNDLYLNKQIPDLFYRDNEWDFEWIGKADWEYSRIFTVTDELLKNDRVILRCEGLDTLATVSVNGTELGKADNMFRTWEWDLKSALTAGDNSIVVRFDSPTKFACVEQEKRALISWCKSVMSVNPSHLRKEQCNFGWDWGVRAVTSGIWRSISVVGYSVARLDGVMITQDHSVDKQVALTVAVAAEHVDDQPLSATVTVGYDGTEVAGQTISLADGKGTAALAITNPELWWPVNMGKQPLYDVKVVLSSGRTKLDETTKRVGLRTLRLGRHADQWGESFQFEINGHPFFAKGANWIPADAILARMTAERYRSLVHDAAKANMNMLRVWGGGIYEDDSFYDACDEYGVCVWQDFMFACAAYPVDVASFIDSVKVEARDNIRRLSHHACIALWCGNNEMDCGELASDKEPAETRMPNMYYEKLFDELLAELVVGGCPDTDYWPSSPHTPYGNRKDANNPTCGDAHLWNVWHGKEPFEWYRTCNHRFNSEFGFQSFPEPKTVYTFTEPKDHNVSSRIMEHHQRSGIGNATIMQYMLSWFRLPMGFENTLWVSQILQGMAIKYACEHYRRTMPRGMGTLYWQYNDTWPVASWSSIDYFGRWKALHYMAKDFYAPLMVSGLEDEKNATVEIHLTNDHLDARETSTRWTVTDLTGKTISEGNIESTVPGSTNAMVRKLDLTQEVKQHRAHNLLIWLEAFAAGSSELVSSNLVLFARPKHLDLGDPEIEVDLCGDGREFTVTLTAKNPALWAWLELADTDALFCSNFVHLRPGYPVTITAHTQKEVTLDRFMSQLTVRSLVDTY